jgi:hypothetical protein
MHANARQTRQCYQPIVVAREVAGIDGRAYLRGEDEIVLLPECAELVAPFILIAPVLPKRIRDLVRDAYRAPAADP